MLPSTPLLPLTFTTAVVSLSHVIVRVSFFALRVTPCSPSSDEKIFPKSIVPQFALALIAHADGTIEPVIFTLADVVAA